MIGGGEEDSRKDLKTCLKNLKMDDKKADIDTSLAKEYLTKYSSKNHGCDPIGQDKHGNNVYIKEPRDLCERTGGLPKNKQIALKIIEQLVNNTELLAQVDYLIRDTNPEYIKRVDVPILINSFKRGIHGNILNDNLTYINMHFCMGAKDPLSKLGLIANTICHTMEPIQITSSKNTTILCNLFLELCIEAGITEDSVLIRVDDVDQTDNAHNGCVAAVTSKCDIDSAIYTLLSSTEDSKYPWKLRRIFVQENIYNKFKSTLAHQTFNKVPDDHLLIKKNAMHVQMYKEKLLIFDYVGRTSSLDWEKPIVSIEGYRTTKELLSLLIKYPSDYLSLWCNDVSTSNEITSKCDAQLIWINNIADFQGSNMLSNIIYYKPELLKLISTKPDFDEKSANAWRNKTYEERKNVLLNVFFDEDQQLYINEWKVPSFYEIVNGKCVSGTAQPRELDYFNIPTNLYKKEVIINAYINSLLMGNCFIINRHSKIPDKSIVKNLQKLGVPITFGSLYSGFSYTRTYKYKIIVSYFGETFSN